MLGAAGGIFTIPSYLSTGARELLLSMLVVDPLQRATIEQIKYGLGVAFVPLLINRGAHPGEVSGTFLRSRRPRNTEWFQQDLPEYLTLPPEVLDEEYSRINDSVVQLLSAVRSACNTCRKYSADALTSLSCVPLKWAIGIENGPGLGHYLRGAGGRGR